MPASFLPLLVPFLLFIALVVYAFKGKRAFLRAVVLTVAIVTVLVLPVYARGWWLMIQSANGSHESTYELARWHENHCTTINTYFLWPCEHDVTKGYLALERAAEAGYPPAMYTLGVRLKYGEFVPKPPNWNGPQGNVFPQPERGEEWITKAKKHGYVATHNEETFYWQVFRR